MSSRGTHLELEGAASVYYDDDDELPSYESCLSEFSAETVAGQSNSVIYSPTSNYYVQLEVGPSTSQQSRPPHSQFQILSSPPEIPRPSRPFPPTIRTDTRPTATSIGASSGSTISLPVDGPPPVRRETRPEFQVSGAATAHIKYGPLLIDGLYPSDTLCRLANALFEQLTPSELLDPLALARAAEPGLGDVAFTPRMLFRFTKLLTLAGIPYTQTTSNIPVLTRTSFIQWLVFEMRADPDYSYVVWKHRFDYYFLHDPQTNSSFNIAPIPRAALPKQPVDPVLTNVHGVWRAIVHVLGKKQGIPQTPEVAIGRGRVVFGKGRGGRGRGRGASQGLEGRQDINPSERRFVRGLERGVRRGIARGIIRSIF